MSDIASSDDAVVTEEILAAVYRGLTTVAPSLTDGPVADFTAQPTQQQVQKLRDMVMAALTTDRARRERHRAPHIEERVLTAAEAGELLGLSRFTMLRMRQLPDAGGLPFVQLSQGRIGYRSRDVTAYLVARRVGRLPGEPEPTQEQQPRTRLIPRRRGREQPHAERSRHIRR
jgi:hypothetical protein